MNDTFHYSMNRSDSVLESVSSFTYSVDFNFYANKSALRYRVVYENSKRQHIPVILYNYYEEKPRSIMLNFQMSVKGVVVAKSGSRKNNFEFYCNDFFMKNRKLQAFW